MEGGEEEHGKQIEEKPRLIISRMEEKREEVEQNLVDFQNNKKKFNKNKMTFVFKLFLNNLVEQRIRML